MNRPSDVSRIASTICLFNGKFRWKCQNLEIIFTFHEDRGNLIPDQLTFGDPGWNLQQPKAKYFPLPTEKRTLSQGLIICLTEKLNFWNQFEKKEIHLSQVLLQPQTIDDDQICRKIAFGKLLLIKIPINVKFRKCRPNQAVETFIDSKQGEGIAAGSDETSWETFPEKSILLC